MIGVSARIVLTVSLVICGVGMLDAAEAREWDLFSIFVLTSLAQVALLLRQFARRTPVSLRSDLARWAQSRAQITGEPVDDVVDRAVAFHRDGLFANPGQQ